MAQHRHAASGDMTDTRTKTSRIADDLRSRILNGELAPGDALPTLAVIRKQWNVSEPIARAALSALRSEGLIESQRGTASRVRQSRPTRRLGIGRYRRSVWSGEDPRPILTAETEDQGRTATQEIADSGSVPAPQWVADALQIEPGDPVWLRARRTAIDGVPNQLLSSYFPEWVTEAAPQLKEESTGPGGTFARLDEVSTLEEVSEVIEGRMPTGPEATTLDMPTGVPVFEVTRVIYDQQERPMEVGHAVVRCDSALFAYRFPIPD